MSITPTDVSVAVNGDIRWTGGAVSAVQYTVLELHRFLQDLADDAQAAGDDLVDISSLTPSERSTDQIITLLNGYNIDDTMAQHLYAGSITQSSGAVVYSGLQVVGNTFSPTELMLIQNKSLLPNYWGTGLNASGSIIHRQLVLTRTGGADIDGKRLRVAARELGDTYAEFEVTMGLGEAVAAIFTSEDINNATAEATIAGWTTITNVEGYQQIDLGNGAGNRDYYSQWNRAALGINDLYERAKWMTMRALTEDENTTATDKDCPVGNASITEQAQSFLVGANDMVLTRVRFDLKATGSPTGNMVAKLYAHSGTYGTSSVPTGAALATSEVIPASRLRTAAYDEIEFVFNGDQQIVLSAATNYVIALVYSAGDGSNYINVAATEATSHGGNRSDYIAGWTADATDDLLFQLFSSFELYNMAGELFRGITHQWNYDGASGDFTENEELTWGSGVTAGSAILIADDDNGVTGTWWVQLTSGVVPVDPTTITGSTSLETADINGTVNSRTLAPCFLGTSTGSALIGAFGVGVEALDLTSNDKLFDLTNTLQIPPNNVQWTLSSVVSGEDRILVGPKDTGDAFKWDQLTLAVDLSGGTEIAIVCVEDIPSDTPAAGTIRIELNSGIRRRVTYTSWTAKTFAIASTDFSGILTATGAKEIMISYIDKLADATTATFNSIFSSTRDLRVRVRDGDTTPIKTYEGNSQLTSAGGGASATRTSDA